MISLFHRKKLAGLNGESLAAIAKQKKATKRKGWFGKMESKDKKDVVEMLVFLTGAALVASLLGFIIWLMASTTHASHMRKLERDQDWQDRQAQVTQSCLDRATNPAICALVRVPKP